MLASSVCFCREGEGGSVPLCLDIFTTTTVHMQPGCFSFQLLIRVCPARLHGSASAYSDFSFSVHVRSGRCYCEWCTDFSGCLLRDVLIRSGKNKIFNQVQVIAFYASHSARPVDTVNFPILDQRRATLQIRKIKDYSNQGYGFWWKLPHADCAWLLKGPYNPVQLLY